MKALRLLFQCLIFGMVVAGCAAKDKPVGPAWNCGNLPPNVTQHSNEYRVTPTGEDDTATVQLAVNCATRLSPSAVILEAGQFRWTQVIARGWVDGRFEGAGADSGLGGAGNTPYVNHAKDLDRYTYIDALGSGTVPIYPPDCNPPTYPNYDPGNPDWDWNDPDCLGFTPSEGEPYPPGTAAMFILEGGGDIEVAHLTWEVTVPDAARNHRAIHGFEEYSFLDYVMLVTHRPPASSSPGEGVQVHDVMFKSLLDQQGSTYGFTARVGLGFDGLMITPGVYGPGDVGMVTSTPFTGKHSVTDCVFDGPAINAEAIGLVDGSVTWAQNRFINGNFGILFYDHDNSVFIVEDNEFIDQGTYGIAAWQRRGAPPLGREVGFRAPEKPSVVHINNNDIYGAGTEAIHFWDGASKFDLPDKSMIGEIVDNNTYEKQGSDTQD